MEKINLLPDQQNEKKWVWIISILSIVIVLAVAFLLLKSEVNTVNSSNSWIYILPKFNAFLNSSVAILLLIGLYLVKQKKYYAHRKVMLTAFIFSSCFLISYVIYHFNAPGTKFGDIDHNNIVDVAEKTQAGASRYIYFFLLITHICLASIIVPFCLFTLYRAFNGQFDKHKKIARWTFPIWLYVSVTGVIVYEMISKYYPF